jgi:dihydropteroate synthase
MITWHTTNNAEYDPLWRYQRNTVLFFRKSKARSLGINDLIIDPGFGFAKTIEQNYEVLRKAEFKSLELPL